MKMKTFNIKLASGLRDLFDETSRKGNAFRPDGTSSTKHSLTCGALAIYCLTMLRRHISDSQYQAYASGDNSNEDIFQLAVAYLRAKRKVKGYRISQRGIVTGPNLKQEIVTVKGTA